MLTISENINLAAHTTFATGGVARYMVTANSVPELAEAFTFAKEHALPVMVLGGGSNVLVADDGFSGLVIKMAITGRRYEATTRGVVTLTCGAGEVFDEVVADTVSRGYWGLENLSAIPGSVGAVPVQNVGAYGVEVSERIVAVEVYDLNTNTTDTLTPEQCQFAYRDSRFKHPNGKQYVVTAVTFTLATQPLPQLQYKELHDRFGDVVPTLGEVRAAVIDIRSHKFPDWRVMGTAGSFFKNPVIAQAEFTVLSQRYPDMPHYDAGDGLVKLPLGWILDKICQAKGRRVGNVGCYEGQALVVVNHGGATTAEIVSFAESLRSEVKEKTDVDIEYEVTVMNNK